MPHSRIRPVLAALAVAGLSLTGVALTAVPAAAASFVVTALGDDDPVVGTTLREAIVAANATPADDDVIYFSDALAGQTIVLDDAKGSLFVTDEVLISGPSYEEITIQRDAGAFDIFFVQMAQADQDFGLAGLSVDGSVGTGRGLVVNGPSMPANYSAKDVDILYMAFTNLESTGIGGAAAIISITGDLTVTGSIFGGNGGDGGGALGLSAIGGDITIEDSLFADNTSSGGGGAIGFGNTIGTVEVLNSTFQSNEALDAGGAIEVGTNTGRFNLSRTVFDDNETTDGSGGALAVLNNALVGLFGWQDLVFTGNTAEDDGGAVWFDTIEGTTLFQTSTYAGNTAGDDGIAFFVDTVLAPGSFRVYQSTIDETGADQYAIHVVNTTDGDTAFDATVALEYSTVFGPGAFLVEHAESSGSLNVYYTIAAASGLPAVSSPDGKAVRVIHSLLSTALTAELVNDQSRFGITDMRLGPLQNNGGFTDTRLPLPGSPAIDTGDPDIAFTPDFDQRGEGFPRVINGVLDIGAVEAPFYLPATGPTVPLWIPIVGGVVLLLGVGALAFTMISRRRLQAAETAPSAPPSDPAGP